MKHYPLRLTRSQWRAVENGLRNLPHNTEANTALVKVEILLDLLVELGDEGEGEGEDDDEAERVARNGNGATAHVIEDRVPALSRRELLILQSLTLGESNKMIARKLVITESTVKVHMKAVLRKLRLANRTQAAMWAQEKLNGLPRPDNDVSSAHRAEA